MLGQRVWGFIVAVSCGFFIVAIAQTTDPVEVKALLAVKSRLIDSMSYLRNWNRDPCNSNWIGVFCFDTIGADGHLHVKELQLLNMNLSGSLAPELGQLSQLQILDFMWNKLTGSIPKEVGNISSLRLLLLNGNMLSGSLPDELGYLASLDRLQVDSNNISGPVPKSFANLINVKHLHLNNNSISGQIPAEISKLPILIHLLLDNNNLSGNLPPEFSNLPELRILQLDNNNFKGSKIPATYGNFSTLAKLSLRNCSLQGAIPDLSMIPNLIYLDLSWNQLTGNIPSNKLSDNMTTIDLSHNHLNGSIPESFSHLPFLQRLSLENNFLTGSVPANIWHNVSFSKGSRLTLDLRNNLLLNILGELNPPENVTLRLEGNPVCRNENILNIGQFCASDSKWDEGSESSTNSTPTCSIYTCPTGDFFEFVPASPVPCYCAAPLRIGYRLKSPSFSYFPQYISSFENYLTSTLDLELYQLSIDSFLWEAGPRLRMYLKIFPVLNSSHLGVFNLSEIQRIRGRYTSWNFRKTDFFGPYELLNFTLLGPYSNNFKSQTTSISEGILAAIIVGAVVACVAVSLIVALLVTRRHARSQHVLSGKHLSSKISVKIEGVKRFAYKEMVLATDNFNSSSQLGRGGYGIVYRGNLSDNTVVAIKRAEEGSLQGQKEFLTEIKLLSRLHHRNLVSLVGYCDEVGEQMLVYEYMPNGTLSDWLAAKAKQNLNFGIRLQIALGSAKGILYLHTEANPPVFHRDIKSSNILLDSHLNAKVADFGLSRLAPVPDSQGTLPNYVSTVVKGTPGYLDPEYFLTHKLTDKSDVYSLGVVFLELLTGMRPISHGKNIVREVNMALESGTMFSIMDSKMGSYPSECGDRFLNLALACCHDSQEKRPPMLDVVRELENILKMMPETDFIFPESSSTHSGQSASYVNRDLYISSDSAGSHLSSSVMSNIIPR